MGGALGDQPMRLPIRRWTKGSLFPARPRVVKLVRNICEISPKSLKSGPVYRWFTERFDTPDLKDARALLDQLRA
jgi:hypothetical protein